MSDNQADENVSRRSHGWGSRVKKVCALSSVAASLLFATTLLAQSPVNLKANGSATMGSATGGVWAITNSGPTLAGVYMLEFHYTTAVYGAASLVLVRQGSSATSTLFSTIYTAATHITYFGADHEYWLSQSNILLYTDTTTNSAAAITWTLEY